MSFDRKTGKFTKDYIFDNFHKIEIFNPYLLKTSICNILIISKKILIKKILIISKNFLRS